MAVLIQTTPTSYRLRVNKYGYLHGTNLNLHRHCWAFNDSEWNNRLKRYELKKKYRLYDPIREKAYFPRYDLPRMEELLHANGIDYIIQEVPVSWGKKVDLPIIPNFLPKSLLQKEAIDFCVNSDFPMRAIALQPGGGKSHSLNTYIKIPGGWKYMRDIQVGDIITAWDGTPTRVTGVFPQGRLPAYRIEFWDGRRTYASGDHLWKSFYKNTTKKQQWGVRTTERLAEILTLHNPHVHIPMIKPEVAPDVDLPIDPYVLGYLLGNGGLSNSTVKVTSRDSEWILNEFAALLPDDVEVRYNCRYDYTIASKVNGVNSISRHIKELGLRGKRSWEKFIPPIYANASPAQRLALLQGLMDSDGTACTGGSTSYSTSSKRLADQVIHLVRGLGGRAKVGHKHPWYTYKGKRIQGRLNYNINIVGRCPSDLFRLPRKKERVDYENQYAGCSDMLRIRKIEPAGEMDMQCIAIDHPDKLYVVDDYIVTHNTCVSLVSAAKLGRRTLIKTPILINQWVGAIKKWLCINDDEIYIISGASSILKLMEEIDKTLHPKIILASLQTLREYASGSEHYALCPPMDEFCDRLDIGTVISDEVHMHFHAALMTDMLLNPKVMIPMSATFEVTSKTIEPIFEGHFPSEYRFGEDRYKKYVDVSSYTFNISLARLPKSKFKAAKGYNHILYEDFLLKNRDVFNEVFDNVYMPILYADYINYALPHEKLLIICSTKNMCLELKKKLQKVFPDKIINEFFSGSPESVKTDSDIVISTVKSAGVGFDMPDLITTFVTVAADSPPLNKQMLGRLREIAGRSPRLAYASCLAVESHVKYKDTRERIFPGLSKSFSTISL